MEIVFILLGAFILGGEVRHELSQPEAPRVEIEIVNTSSTK